MTAEHHQGAFSADISKDTELASTILSLAYEDPQNPARSMSISIAPDLGSNLYRFRVGNHEIIHCERELLKQMSFTGDFVLWPLPNRIRDRRYSFQGQDYSLVDVERPQGNYVLIHGLVFDRQWHYEQPVVKQDAVSVTTYVDINKESDHWYESYPFDSRLSLTYTLNREGVHITYQVQNKGQRVLPFGFALHPYFSLLSGKQDTYVSVPVATVMEADEELLPTGRLLDVRGTMYAMFDVRQPVAVGNLKLDHVYMDLQPGAPAIIDYRQQGLQLHISATDDFTHAIIYTATEKDNFFCLEHQTCSTDAINLHHQGEERRRMAHLLEVQPGESFQGTLNYQVKFSH
ncbi:aldose 1-epimerase [Dictyobacter formicarum]|uniref:Aldose 1-epimerase n=1 Tax=Dictyobacter formicarum TaxID=2778368 RepID=A0ABQ3VN66_9CHLR|nr:aldose 1-epimerase [Dictyobacter formicarum]GHO86831.1 aldose 1-epimerase [Dictyobacter formicarum]